MAIIGSLDTAWVCQAKGRVMEIITTTLVLLLAIVVSGAISRAIPIILPLPLIQIALGAIIGLSADLSVRLDPEIFFLLFLPPLLFLDGWRIAADELKQDMNIVVELALGLVVFTVLGAGLLIHWMIPAMPLAVAFALAAVISPTDPIAVSAIAQRVPIPPRMMHILEGEALLNDASGLVCLRFAIAAALTGSFSLYDAALSFLWTAFGGLAIGVGVTWSITWLTTRISRRYGEESGSEILVSILIPFAAYLIAEQLHCSGILAAVSAGVTMSVAESSGHAMAATRVRRNSVWDMIQFAANGTIFVLLGEQLPSIVEKASATVEVTGHQGLWWLAIYVVGLAFGLAALRFTWVWLSLHLTLFRQRRQRPTSPNWRILAAFSFAGVRGAITLAGVLTLPFTLNDGSPFPARDLAICLAMGVIIMSLILATLFLPPLLKNLELPQDTKHEEDEVAARVDAARAAITEIARLQHSLSKGQEDADLYVEAASRVMELYRERIRNQTGGGEEVALSKRTMRIELELRLAAVRAERTEIFRKLRARQLGNEVAAKLVRELDLLEARYAS
ncbi:sodium/proton antiporter, CPA1 family (TC 2.A.36) [Rhizobium multihospitium]|uniref:Sodium/proton antiporter, CPA1 family (TC 2.A.36) n=2 Tax=Rhizobium multihospitium TaxID=410764 RepID=A0A1C3UGI2_9HYPH|nr:sodium/proton antiporter, CPA1 family (TC 2.A.36) [Rhizobium multihospitium]